LAHRVTHSLHNEEETQGRWKAESAGRKKTGEGEGRVVVGVVIDAYSLLLVCWRRMLWLLVALVYIYIFFNV
jgi:hypothetical protein